MYTSEKVNRQDVTMTGTNAPRTRVPSRVSERRQSDKTDNSTNTAGELNKSPLPWGQETARTGSECLGTGYVHGARGHSSGADVPPGRGDTSPRPCPPPGTLVRDPGHGPRSRTEVRDGGQGAVSRPRPLPPWRDARGAADSPHQNRSKDQHSATKARA